MQKQNANPIHTKINCQPIESNRATYNKTYKYQNNHANQNQENQQRKQNALKRTKQSKAEIKDLNPNADKPNIEERTTKQVKNIHYLF